MAFTKEQRIINSMSGSTKQQRNLKATNPQQEQRVAIGGGFIPNHDGVKRHMKDRNIPCSGDHRNENGDGWVIDVAPSSETGAAFDIGRLTGYSNSGNTEIGMIQEGLFLSPKAGDDTSNLSFIATDGNPWYKIEGDYAAGTITVSDQLGTLNSWTFQDGDVNISNDLYVQSEIIKPSRMLYQCGENNSTIGAGATQPLVSINGVSLTTGHGLAVLADGTIDYFSVVYTKTSLGSHTLKYRMYVNDVLQYTSSGNSANSAGIQLSANPNVTVSQGDIIRWEFQNTGANQCSVTKCLLNFRVTET